MNQTIVTGAAGFIGTTLCRHLLESGQAVVALDRVPGARQEHNLATLRGATLLRADLAALPDLHLRRVLEGVDAVVHLAGQPGVQTSWGEGFGAHLDGNVALAQRLLEAALDVGVPRVVLASSSSVYGSSTGAALREDQPLCPISPYGATKAAMELVANAYAARGVSVVSLRYFTVYGRRQRPDMAIHRILSAGLGGPVFEVRGDGSQSRDFTHVDDVVAATVAAVRRPLLPGTVINVGSGRPVTLDAVVRACGEVLGRPIPTRRVALSPGDPRLTSADSTRARALLGWAPTTTLLDGLEDQLRWLLRNGARRPEPLVRAS